MDRMVHRTTHRRARHARAVPVWLLAAACAGCGPADPRPQWVVEIDTDALLTGQILADPDLPRVVALDTLRIDVLAEDGALVEQRDVVAPDARDWPVSFGVVAVAAGARLRIRAFRGQDAVPDTGGSLLPPPRLTIDRLVVLDPADEKRVARVTLSLSCLGIQPSFVSPERTCVDEERRDAPATEGLDARGGATAAGTSPWLAAEPCRGAPPPDSVCIPGGLDVLGDRRLEGLEDTFAVDAAPPMAVRLSPLFMDRFEVSVGQVRTLYASGAVTAPPPLAFDPGNPDQAFCNWRGLDDASRDGHPVNCLAVGTARAICSARGGRLPTEAEWEHAARGRGLGHARPWGNDDPLCCATQASHLACSRPAGTALVDAHAAPPDCPFGDLSRDGVVGLAGNVQELTDDAARAYDSDCWQYEGVPLDPRCDLPDPIRVARGGSWNNSLSLTHAAFRVRYVPSGNGGFRCVYDDVDAGAR